MRKNFVRFLWSALIALVVFMAAGGVAIWNGWVGYMPPVEELQNPISRYASQVFS